MRKVRMIGLMCGAVALAGCASQTKTPTQQEAAMKRWNAARAGVLVGLAQDQYNHGSIEKGRVSIDEAAKLSPDSAPIHVLSAKFYIEAGQLEAAERELTLARMLDPNNAQADYLSGIVYQRWQQPEHALEFYEDACEKAPAELAYVLAKAEMLVDMDRRADALQMLQQKVTYFEHSAAIRDEVGLLLEQDGRYHEAVEMFRRASILAPDELTIKEHLALAFYYDGRYEDSAAILSDLLNQDKYKNRPDLLLALGECELQTNRAGAAVRAFQEACDLSPASPDICLSLAQAELQEGDYTRCEQSLKRCLAFDSENSQAYLLLGYLRLRQLGYRDALEAFSRAAELAPNDTVSLCMLGVALQKLGRPDEANNCYQKALKMKPDDPLATRLLAKLDLHD